MLSKFLIVAIFFNCNIVFAKSICTEKYDRAKFNYDIDFDSDCETTRAEVLIERKLDNVILSKNCKVKNGKWIDEYTNEYLYDPKQLQIDHLISLKEAWELGACNWTPEKRTQFANDHLNLVITSSVINMSKGAKTLNEWSPRANKCKIITQARNVALKYELNNYKAPNC